jgi:alpha-beta hydrolase superfamily lysophospholipase
MIERAEYQLVTPDTHENLFMQTWRPKDKPAKMAILLTHGVLEHSDCYDLMAPSLAEAGIQVFGWDLPGHGRSYGQRGYIHDFQEYVDRLNYVLGEVHKILPAGLPLFLFGHSMGGTITLKFAMDNSKADYTGIILSSPGLGVAAEVPVIKDLAARLLNQIAPRLTIAHELNFADLSRDPEVVKTYSRDPLRHKKFSAPLYLGLLETMNDVNRRGHQLTKPLFIQAAGADRVTSVQATKDFFQTVGSAKKELKIYPDSYHEIFNDVNRKEVIDDLISYLRQFENA